MQAYDQAKSYKRQKNGWNVPEPCGKLVLFGKHRSAVHLLTTPLYTAKAKEKSMTYTLIIILFLFFISLCNK